MKPRGKSGVSESKQKITQNVFTHCHFFTFVHCLCASYQTENFFLKKARSKLTVDRFQIGGSCAAAPRIGVGGWFEHKWPRRKTYLEHWSIKCSWLDRLTPVKVTYGQLSLTLPRSDYWELAYATNIVWNPCLNPWSAPNTVHHPVLCHNTLLPWFTLRRWLGFGFITFEDEQSVDQAVNMHFHDIMGKKVCSCSFILP